MGINGSLLDKQAALAATSPEKEPGQTHQKRAAVRANYSQAATPVAIWAKQAVGKTRLACHSEESRSDRDDEESCTALKILGARFLAEFTLSQLRRFFSPDRGIRMTGEGHRMTANGLGMTAWSGSSAACKGAIIIQQLQGDGGLVVSGNGATAASAGDASATTA